MRIHIPGAALLALSFTVPAFAATRYTTAYTETCSIAATGNRAAAVNRNAASPYFGYLYVVVNANTVDRAIRIYAPNPESQRTAARAYSDTNRRITMSTTPIHVCIGSDDTVWILTSGGNILTAPAMPPTNAPVQAFAQKNIVNTVSLFVSGPINNATLWLSVKSTSTTIQCYTGSASSWDSQGAFNQVWSRNYAKPTFYAVDEPPVVADSTGSIYVARASDTASAVMVEKRNSSGDLVTGWQAVRPSFLSSSLVQTSLDIVEDASLPGGGYLLYAARVYNANALIYVHRFRLDNGQWLDGFGPTDDAPAGTYSTLPLTNTEQKAYLHTDDCGNVYLATDGNTTVRKIMRTPEFSAATEAVRSSPTVFNGVVYFGSDDGVLRAVNAGTGADAWSFATRPGAGAAAKIVGRPALRFAGGEARLFFVTDTGWLFQRNPDNTQYAAPLQLPGATSVATAPAVDENAIFVAGMAGVTPRVWRVPLDGGAVASVDLQGSAVRSSPSLYGNNVFVGTLGTGGQTWRLQASNLTVLSDAETEPTASSPFVASTSSVPVLYTVTQGGKVYAFNASTFTPVAGFGGGGVQTLTDGEVTPRVESDLFAWGGRLFIGGLDNKVYALQSGSGAPAGQDGSQVFFDAGGGGGAGGITGGLAVNPAVNAPGNPCLAFGSTSGIFYTVLLSDPDSYRATRASNQPLQTAPAVDMAGNALLAGCDDGRLYRIPGM